MTLELWHVHGEKIVKPQEAPWADFIDGDRLCFFCGYPCLPEDHPMISLDSAYYAHFTCWYDNGPMPPQRYIGGPDATATP